MTIAVTGGCGFIGTHVLRALIAAGIENPIAVDRVAPSQPVNGVRYVGLDLGAATSADYDRIGRPDVLVHLAWGGLPNYLSLHHFEQELPLQYGFLKAMVEGGLPAMVVAGTCYEYGMVDGELTEEMEPRPANPYAFAKVALLEQLRFLKQRQAFKLTWPRLFYMWGEGQAPSSLYPLLRGAIERGDATFPMSLGEQLRDYLPVGEVARLIAALAVDGGDHGVVNISSGEPVSIRSLVERWIAEMGSAIALDRGRYPYPTYEPLAFWGATAKRRALLAEDR
jgi:dTDP-6-deoxy-L-talose 4-dehydrogenase (NAD+)